MTAPAWVTAPRFEVGDVVRVHRRRTDRHVRTPAYAMGRVGTVESRHGPFPDPETLAYGGSGEPARWLYCVRFSLGEVWSEQACGEDALLLDLFEPWLDSAPVPAGERSAS